MDYKIIKSKYGFRYMKGSRLVKKADIPEEILATLQVPEPVAVEPEIPYKRCIFCTQHTNLARNVNQKMVYVCDEHYYSTNIGQVAQQLRNYLQGVTHESQTTS